MAQYFNLNSLNSPKVDQEGAQKLIKEDGLVPDITLYDDEMSIYMNAAKCGDWVEEFLKKLSLILKEGEYFLLHCVGEEEAYDHSFFVITGNEVVDLPAKVVINDKQLLETHPEVKKILSQEWPELLG